MLTNTALDFKFYIVEKLHMVLCVFTGYMSVVWYPLKES